AKEQASGQGEALANLCRFEEFRGPFPLTPALSPGRGRSMASLPTRRDVPNCPCAADDFPSPWGEGLGGERNLPRPNVRFLQTSQVTILCGLASRKAKGKPGDVF